MNYAAKNPKKESKLLKLLKEKYESEEKILEKVLIAYNKRLTPRRKLILQHRLPMNGFEYKTLTEIGTILGVSSERIRQLEFTIYKKIIYDENA